MLTLKNAAIVLLLILATVLSAWAIIISRSEKSPLTQTDPNEVDSYMETVNATLYTKTGTPALELVSPRMVHYPANNTTNIATPRVTIFRKSPEPWYIDADYAKATNGMNQILFWSHVNIHHTADTENPTTLLRTDALTIFPNNQIASTQDAVTFIQPDTTVHAVGMLANLEAGTVKLLSQAKGIYDPAS